MMRSNKPYLLRAFYQWMTDNACVPILVVDVNHPHCKLPKDYVEGDEMVFNVSPVAVRDLKITNELIEFKASFSGVIHFISVPVKAVLALYAEENGEGIFFDAEEENDEESIISIGENISTLEAHEAATIAQEGANKNKPFLRLVE